MVNKQNKIRYILLIFFFIIFFLSGGEDNSWLSIFFNASIFSAVATLLSLFLVNLITLLIDAAKLAIK